MQSERASYLCQVLSENLSNLIIDWIGDSVDSSAASKSTDGTFRDAFNVVTLDLALEGLSIHNLNVTVGRWVGGKVKDLLVTLWCDELGHATHAASICGESIAQARHSDVSTRGTCQMHLTEGSWHCNVCC